MLVKLDGPPVLKEWRTEQGLQQDWPHWLSSRAVRQFESGKISPETFADQLIDEFGLSIGRDEYLQHFKRWLSGLYDGVHNLLDELRPHYRLAVLSNTNELHWPRMMHDMQLAGQFDHYFASFDIGMTKPDHTTFEYVIEQINKPPHEILFLDDAVRNIEAARACGMQAVQVEANVGVRETIESIGLLPKSSK